jgi:hypothetical protein
LQGLFPRARTLVNAVFHDDDYASSES